MDREFYRDLWDTILSGREWRGVFCNKKKNGEIFWEKASISSIKDDKNKIIRFIGLKEDITQEREKEEQERLRIQQQIKYRTVLFKLSQMSFEDIETGLKAITESMAVFLEAKQVSICYNFPLFIMGNQFGILSVQQIKDKRNWTDKDQNFTASIASIVSTLFETFERIEAEKKLIVAVEDAKRANRIKSDFLANMSHEIRTPMNAIFGFSQILMSKIEDEEERSFIESINSSAKHLLSLINDILDLSKVEAGKTDIVYEPCNFPALIGNLEKMFLHKLIKTEVTLDIDLAPEIPKALLLDEDRLTQVLTNLVGNAVKFTKTGSIKISSYFSYPDKNDGSISLTIDIDDTGVGIPEDEWENVFNPFDQTREGAKAEYSGTGLGLAISRKLIDLMNGDIRIVGKEYNLPKVINWGKTLSKAVTSFNKDNIMETLNTFSGLIIEIEELKDLEGKK